MCWYEQFPAVKFFENDDLTGAFPGLTCEAVLTPHPSSNWKSWAGMWKLVRLLESWPWE